MKYSVLTSFNANYWNEVAKENVFQLDKNWIESGDIFLYHQLPKPEKKDFSNRVNWIDLYENCPELPEFVENWKDHPKANGSIKGFRTNAVKFVHKTFAIWHAAKTVNTDWLIWLDCDAHLHKKVDESYLKTICPESALVSYVGRPGKYSECGFLAFNLNHEKTSTFLKEWEQLYVSGEFVNLSETHDSWTFDYIRKQWDAPELFFNLNARAVTNKNPFSQSMLGDYLVHTKGKGKSQQLSKVKNRLRKTS